MKTLYKFHHNGCYGSHYGLFVADSDVVEELIADKAEVYMGEASGKHSEVWVELSDETITRVNEGDDPDIIALAHNLDLCFGYNPLDHLEKNDD